VNGRIFYTRWKVILSHLEPAHVEEELYKGQERKVKVADEAVVQLPPSNQTSQHEYVHRQRRHLKIGISTNRLCPSLALRPKHTLTLLDMNQQIMLSCLSHYLRNNVKSSSCDPVLGMSSFVRFTKCKNIFAVPAMYYLFIYLFIYLL